MTLGHSEFSQRTQDVKISEDVMFETMLLNNQTLNGLKSSGFYRPSPIQLHGIPLGKCGFDLLLEAKSGTGKTAVFTIITLEKLDLNKGLQTIILAPTREIVAQVGDVIKQIGSDYKGLNVEVVMGGLAVQNDIKKFQKRVHVVVGSPGRLKHLIHDGYIDVSSVRLLIIDECDKLMEKSFLPDVNYIFSVLPIQKQVIMSSATYPEECKVFISKYVQNAQHICPNNNTILLGIVQHVTTVQHNNNIVRQTQYKFEELLKILSKYQYKQCLIFCNYQARVADIHKKLKKEKWPVELLHGQQDQTHRLDALKTLQEYKCRILTATDLAARGIDASNVDLVINFEPPVDWQTYLHRIGRAGRFGSYGIAITILSKGIEVDKFRSTLKTMKMPLMISNLWTGDDFNNENLDDTTQNGLDTKTQLLETVEASDEHFKDLWNSLIKEEEKSESLESFETLVNSYQVKNVTKTESFSDLLESFGKVHEVSNVNEEDTRYKCITMNEIPIKEYLDYIKNEKSNLNTETKIYNNVCVNLEHGIPTSKVCHNTKEPDDIYVNTNEKNSVNTDENKTTVSDNEDIKIYDNVSKLNIQSDESDTGNCNINNYKTNSLQKTNTDLLENYFPISLGKIKTQNVSKLKNENQRQSVIKISQKSNSNKIKSSQRINNRSKKDLDHVLTTHMRQNKHGYFDYNMWYNQLKTRMKYVEYAFYIEEMSKL